VPDGPFWDPEADADFLETLRANIRADIPISTHAKHVNDPDFGVVVAEQFLDLMKSGG
jgi:uncharacterized protein (UPF0261 family)